MQVIRINELIPKTSLSRTTIWRLEKQGQFPKRFKLSARTSCWCLSEIDEWLEMRKSKTSSF